VGEEEVHGFKMLILQMELKNLKCNATGEDVRNFKIKIVVHACTAKVKL